MCMKPAVYPGVSATFTFKATVLRARKTEASTVLPTGVIATVL